MIIRFACSVSPHRAYRLTDDVDFNSFFFFHCGKCFGGVSFLCVEVPSNAVVSHILTFAMCVSVSMIQIQAVNTSLYIRSTTSSFSCSLNKCPWTFLHAFPLIRSFVHLLVDTFSHSSIFVDFIYSCSIERCNFQLQSSSQAKPNQLFSNKLEFAVEFDYGLLYEM